MLRVKGGGDSDVRSVHDPVCIALFVRGILKEQHEPRAFAPCDAFERQLVVGNLCNVTFGVNQGLLRG